MKLPNLIIPKEREKIHVIRPNLKSNIKIIFKEKNNMQQMKCPRCGNDTRMIEETMTTQVFICSCELKITCEETFN